MALILTRKEGEEIVIGDDIVVRIVFCKKNIAKLAIEAPEGVAINRREIYDLIKAKEDKNGQRLQSRPRNNIA